MFPNSPDIAENPLQLFTQSDPSNAANAQYATIMRENRVNTLQDQGVNHNVLQGGRANIAGENSAQYGNEKNKPSATVDPLEIEAQWTARLAKYAGIAQSTGVKIK